MTEMSYPLAALRRPRYLLSRAPWRALAYLAITVPIATPYALGFLVLALPELQILNELRHGRVPDSHVVLLMLFAVLLVAAFGPLVAAPLAAVERARLRMIDPRPVRSGHRPAQPGLLPWLRVRYTEAASWREVAYAFVAGAAIPLVYSVIAFLKLLNLTALLSPWLVTRRGAISLSLGPWQLTGERQAIPAMLVALVLLPCFLYLFGLVAAAQAAVTRYLLGARDPDGIALREVTRSRERLVDSFEAERRRIERDLHDGAQHRLTSLTLQLGVARMDLPDDSPAGTALARAHEQAKDLMVELRELVHGIHPRTLTDLGLAAAVRELADRSTLPVRVAGEVERLPAAVEAAAYYGVAEALSNAVRHSGASHAEVTLSRDADQLLVVVRDDGHGGADPAGGTGLAGLADRASVAGGRLLLASPDGGPTVVRMELPCPS